MSLPLLVILICSSVIGMFLIAKNAKRRNQKLLPIGYSLIGIGALGGFLIKINNELLIFLDTTWLGLFVFFTSGSGIVISIVGKYLTIKGDGVEKTKFFVVSFG